MPISWSSYLSIFLVKRLRVLHLRSQKSLADPLTGYRHLHSLTWVNKYVQPGHEGTFSVAL